VTRSTSEVEEICAGLGRFLHQVVFPLHEEHADLLDEPHRRYGEDGFYTPAVLDLVRQVREASAEAGYYLMTLPAAIGGGEIGWEGLYRTWEHLYTECGPLRWLGHHAIAHWTRGPNPLLTELAPSVRDRYLPGLASGRTSMCFAMSEPDAGSDSWMMRTRATRADGGWVLSGTKQWVTNGAHAELAIVFAVTDPEAAAARRGGIGAFAVPTASPGFSAGRSLRMFGHAGSDETVIHLDDVTVPDDHVLGDPGQGFPLAMRGVSLGRLYNCARAVGLAQWALDLAVAHARDRIAFGTPLLGHQGIAFPLADSALAVHAARLVSLDAARLLEAGKPARAELAMAKICATESAEAVIDQAMQVHGAAGFVNELGLSEAWHMARAGRVADGTGEILRRQIVNQLGRQARG
jgi:acyl-CoA dehydrogenase